MDGRATTGLKGRWLNEHRFWWPMAKTFWLLCPKKEGIPAVEPLIKMNTGCWAEDWAKHRLPSRWLNKIGLARRRLRQILGDEPTIEEHIGCWADHWHKYRLLSQWPSQILAVELTVEKNIGSCADNWVEYWLGEATIETSTGSDGQWKTDFWPRASVTREVPAD